MLQGCILQSISGVVPKNPRFDALVFFLEGLISRKSASMNLVTTLHSSLANSNFKSLYSLI